MGAREVIAEGCCRPDWNKLDTADHIINLLHKSGYVILSPDEVRGMEFVIEIANRNEATTEGSTLAASIRSMKGGAGCD